MSKKLPDVHMKFLGPPTLKRSEIGKDVSNLVRSCYLKFGESHGVMIELDDEEYLVFYALERGVLETQVVIRDHPIAREAEAKLKAQGVEIPVGKRLS
jgi:hypothetical protein